MRRIRQEQQGEYVVFDVNVLPTKNEEPSTYNGRIIRGEQAGNGASMHPPKIDPSTLDGQFRKPNGGNKLDKQTERPEWNEDYPDDSGVGWNQTAPTIIRSVESATTVVVPETEIGSVSLIRAVAVSLAADPGTG